MPAPGDQYRNQASAANPFEEQIPRLSEYTAQEIAILQSRLDKQLGPEYISTRPGNGGGKVHYLAAEKVINLANEVFGFNGWSSQIKDVQVDFVDESPQSGKVSLGLSIITRVSLKDGTFHEDIGYGHIENCKGKAAAFEKAKKEAATDALKRALRNFGNVLGNCLYDKDYLQKVTKVKVQPSRWDADNLHRHPDFAPTVKQEIKAVPATTAAKQIEDAPREQPAELLRGRAATSNHSIEFEDDFGGNLFDGVELPANNTEDVNMDGPSRPDTPVFQNQQQPHNNMQRTVSAGKPIQQNNHQQNPPQFIAPQRPAQPQHQARTNPSRPPQAQAQPQKPHPAAKPTHSTPPDQQATPHPHPQPLQQPTPQSLPQHPLTHSDHQPHNQSDTSTSAAPAGHEPPIGFYTSRALQPNGGGLASNTRFNPNAESPSIRKTNGFNHAMSRPVTRAAQQNAATSVTANDSTSVSSRASSVGPAGNNNNSVGSVPTNFINPSENMTRRIGAPAGGNGSGSGMSPAPLRTSAYKPPTMTNGGIKRSYAASVGVGIGAAQVDGAGGGDGGGGGVGREPLRDVNGNVPAVGGGGGEGGGDVKRVRADG